VTRPIRIRVVEGQRDPLAGFDQQPIDIERHEGVAPGGNGGNLHHLLFNGATAKIPPLDRQRPRVGSQVAVVLDPLVRIEEGDDLEEFLDIIAAGTALARDAADVDAEAGAVRANRKLSRGIRKFGSHRRELLGAMLFNLIPPNRAERQDRYRQDEPAPWFGPFFRLEKYFVSHCC
jgi:hypothetical protein